MDYKMDTNSAAEVIGEPAYRLRYWRMRTKDTGKQHGPPCFLEGQRWRYMLSKLEQWRDGR